MPALSAWESVPSAPLRGLAGEARCQRVTVKDRPSTEVNGPLMAWFPLARPGIPQVGKIVRALCAVTGRCCWPVVTAIAVTAAVNRPRRCQGSFRMSSGQQPFDPGQPLVELGQRHLPPGRAAYALAAATLAA